jgi:hypothetical protein
MTYPGAFHHTIMRGITASRSLPETPVSMLSRTSRPKSIKISHFSLLPSSKNSSQIIKSYVSHLREVLMFVRKAYWWFLLIACCDFLNAQIGMLEESVTVMNNTELKIERGDFLVYWKPVYCVLNRVRGI